MDIFVTVLLIIVAYLIGVVGGAGLSGAIEREIAKGKKPGTISRFLLRVHEKERSHEV